MKLVSGDIYMAPISVLPDAVYAYVPKRIWWKPWRWNLYILGYPPRNKYFEVVYNLSKLEAIGLMKLRGVLHTFD